MKEKLITGLIALAALLTVSGMKCNAEIAGDDAFSNLTWEQTYEDNLIGPVGVVQSICATEDYIICIENTAEDEQADVVSAYYKNSVDKDGNPVQQYSLAKRVNDMNWEHGNGMAYNPNTGEIYVALYTNIDPENRGCLYVMDPETLGCKGKIKISDDYNILGIGYKEDTDQYVIQTNADGGYSFKILDSKFQVAEDLGQYADTAKGDNFQDLTVSGDYIINFPLTLNLGIGDYMHAYSISRRTLAADPVMNFNFTDVVADEPESLCETEPGVFLAAVNVTTQDGQRKLRFYKTSIPYYFQVNVTAGDNGTVTGSEKVLRGESFPIKYEAADGYELSSLVINGEEADITDSKEGFTLENVQQDFEIQASFSKAPPASIQIKKSGIEFGSIHIKFTLARTLAVIMTACFAAAFYLYLVHVRRERKRKLLYARKRRLQIESEVEN